MGSVYPYVSLLFFILFENVTAYVPSSSCEYGGTEGILSECLILKDYLKDYADKSLSNCDKVRLMGEIGGVWRQ